MIITDTEIKQRGIKALIADLGNVQAERFISLTQINWKFLKVLDKYLNSYA